MTQTFLVLCPPLPSKIYASHGLVSQAHLAEAGETTPLL